MNDKFEQWDEFANHFVGYPCNLSYDYGPVFDSLRYNVNNAGDPSIANNYAVNSKDIEREVLTWFKNLWGIDPNSSWGYVTSSGTEGNMEGLYMARLIHPDAILYYSDQAHYSITKIADVLRIESVVVNSQPSGEMDYSHLAECVDTSRHAIVCATLGTTMLGAHDDVTRIFDVFDERGMTDKHYIHVDGALDGFVFPLLSKDLYFKSHTHSMSISGHKFLGVPFPCGIFLMDSKLNKIERFVEYVNTVDNTISGSRSGHAPIFMRHAITRLGIDVFKEDAMKCAKAAMRLEAALRKAGLKPVIRNSRSITVAFPAPSEAFAKRWGLPCHKGISHAVLLPHVTGEMLDDFIKEYLDDMTEPVVDHHLTRRT